MLTPPALLPDLPPARDPATAAVKATVQSASHATHLAYRPDIDGLRAIAVGTVIAFHLQMSAFQGGFIGVDVFFVISGYLISSILLSDLNAERFSLREFYVRRIRRILPALVVALLGTTALAVVFSLPPELIDYAKSLIAATLSAANLYFGFHSSYFDPRSFSRPALQTWSLGVEEQFYLLFPPLLWLVHRQARRHLSVILGVLALGSFILSSVLAFRSSELAYFMPYSRAWELLMGTFLAVPMLPRLRSVVVRNVLAAVGLLLVLAAAHFYGLAIPFPGIAALPPCAGAALLIWSGQTHGPDARPTLTARLLAARPLVFLGLISYSLYLWHWPIVVFSGMGGLWGDGLPVRVTKAISVAVMLLLAVLSWRFVERPFRAGRFRLSGAGAFRFAGASAALLVAIGAATLIAKGFPQRFPARVIAIGSFLDEPMDYRMGTCLVIARKDFKPGICLHQDNGRPNWLLLGDSHAAAHWTGLVQALPGVNILQATHSFCHPDPAQTGDDCGEFMQSIFNGYLKDHRVDRIVASSRWTMGDIAVVDRLVAWARDRNIPLTILGPTQDYDVALPRLLALSILRHDPALPYRHRTHDPLAVDLAFAQAAANRWHVPYVSMVQTFCSLNTCETYTDAAKTVPLQFDTDHFTNEGSVLAARRMVAAGQLEPSP